MSKAILHVKKHASCYWQRHGNAYPVNAALLGRLHVKLDERALAVFVPFGALRAGRRHLLDFSDKAFSYPFRVMVTVLLAVAHATASMCRLAVSYAPAPPGATKADSGYFLVLYPRENQVEDEDEEADTSDVTAYSARTMSAPEWIRERLMRVASLDQLAELGIKHLPKPKQPAPSAGVGEDDEDGEGGGGGGKKQRKPPTPHLNEREHVFWTALSPAFTRSKMYSVVCGYMARLRLSGDGGGYMSDTDALLEALDVQSAVGVRRLYGYTDPNLSLERELERCDPHGTRTFVPPVPHEAYMVPEDRHHPSEIAAYHMPHKQPFVNVDDPTVIRWVDAAIEAARADGRNITRDQAIDMWTAQLQTEVSHSPPPVYQWLAMMKKRYASGAESRAKLDRIFVDLLRWYMNPDSTEIGQFSSSVCAWMEDNMPHNTWANMRFVQTNPDDDIFTANQRLVQAVMNHGMGISGGHEMLTALIILVSMERVSLDGEGGTSMLVTTGPAGSGKSRIHNLIKKGLPAHYSSLAHQSALAQTGVGTTLGGVTFFDEASLSMLGYPSSQKLDVETVLKMALQGGPNDCASGDNETLNSINKQTLGGEKLIQTAHLELVELPDGSGRKERQRVVTDTFYTGVYLANTNFPLGFPDAIAGRIYGVFVFDDPNRQALIAALSSRDISAPQFVSVWAEMNKRRTALFQLLHVGIAGGFLPDVDPGEVGLVLARVVSCMEAMCCPVLSTRIVLRVQRFIRWQAMDTGLTLFALIRNPTKSFEMEDLRLVMACASPTWSNVISTVTRPNIGFGTGDVTCLIIRAIINRFYRSLRKNQNYVGYVKSDRCARLDGASLAQFVRVIAGEIAPSLPDLSPPQLIFYLAMMLNNRLTSPVVSGRRVPMILRTEENRPPYIELMGSYLREPRGPALAAVLACVPVSVDIRNPQPTILAPTSYVGRDGKFEFVEAPRRVHMVVDEDTGDVYDPEVRRAYEEKEADLQQANDRLDQAQSALYRLVRVNAVVCATNTAATENDHQAARREAEQQRAKQARVFGDNGLPGATADGEPSDDSELPPNMREPDERLDDAEMVAVYNAEKTRIKTEIERLKGEASVIRAWMTSMSIMNPVTLSHGLIKVTSNVRDASPSDRLFASRWGVDLPVPRSHLDPLTTTDATFSEVQLKACGFTAEEIQRHVGFAPNTRRYLHARALVDAAFGELCDEVVRLVSAERGRAGGMADDEDEGGGLALNDATDKWAGLMAALYKAAGNWQGVRAGMTGATDPMDQPWARYWAETHFQPHGQVFTGTVVIENVATFFLAACSQNMAVAIEVATQASASMGLVGVGSSTVRSAVTAAVERMCMSAAKSNRRRTQPDTDADPEDEQPRSRHAVFSQ